MRGMGQAPAIFVDAFGSATTSTWIHEDGGVFHWEIVTEDHSVIAAARSRALKEVWETSAAGSGEAGLLRGAFRTSAWHYIAPGPHTFADVVLSGRFHPSMAPLFSQVGASLAILHGAEVQEPLPPPPGPVLVLEWLQGSALRFVASHWRPDAREILGQDAWALLTDWAEDQCDSREQGTAHGGFGLGALLCPEGPEQRAHVLTGHHLSRGRPEVDRGHLLGDLLEHASRRPEDQESVTAAIAAFEQGYGQAFTPADHRSAVLRVLTHAVDYVDRVAGATTPDVVAMLRFVGYLIDNGTGGQG